MGQTVPHVHFHYIPRLSGDDSVIKFMFKMYIVNLMAPISSLEMQERVEKMQEAIGS